MKELTEQCTKHTEKPKSSFRKSGLYWTLLNNEWSISIFDNDGLFGKEWNSVTGSRFHMEKDEFFDEIDETPITRKAREGLSAVGSSS